MEEDEQRLRVRLVGSDGRRRYDPASVDRLVAACLEPGVSVSRLALEHGVNVNLLRKWIQKARQVSPAPAALAFVPVQVGPDQSLPVQRSSLDKSIKRLSCAARLSASLPNGVSVTVVI
ncbi:IS66-like element accessory protein TnpA [Rhizobium nepotum]|uniref:IS66-like element accessory protein TnpA n=1 Tax=Rhizobium nepotum TaxID=1035271 RepID=UPI0005D3E7B8|nr:transposase [Rhizobium nepotum]